MPETNIPAAGATIIPQAPATSMAVEGTAQPLELEHTFTDFESIERTMVYHFRKPSRPQISRAQNSMRKDSLSALRTLCLDVVVPDEKERIKADFAKYEGLASTFGTEILLRVGFGELGK